MAASEKARERETVLLRQEDALQRGVAKVKDLTDRIEQCVARTLVPLPPPKAEPQ